MVLAPLESFLSLDRVDDIVDVGAAHRQRYSSLNLQFCIESIGRCVLLGWVSIPGYPGHIYLPSQFLVALEIFKRTWVKGISQQVPQGLAVTFVVVYSELHRLLDHDRFFLGLDLVVVLGALHFHQLRAAIHHLFPHAFDSWLVVILVWCRKFAVLGLTDRVLIQGWLHQKLAVFNAHTRSSVNPMVILYTRLGSRHRVLRGWVTYVSPRVTLAHRLAILPREVFLKII